MGGSMRRHKKNKPKIIRKRKDPNKKIIRSKLPQDIASDHAPRLENKGIEQEWNAEATQYANYDRLELVSDVNAGYGRNPAKDAMTEKIKADPTILDKTDIDDDLTAALAKTRSTGKAAPKRLTPHQRQIITKLVAAHVDNVDAMVLDRRLNSMQHSKAKLEGMIESLGYWKEGSGVDFRVPNKRLW